MKCYKRGEMGDERRTAICYYIKRCSERIQRECGLPVSCEGYGKVAEDTERKWYQYGMDREGCYAGSVYDCGSESH